jgi:histone H3/H4
LQRLEHFQRIENASHPDVVGDTAVDEMQIGPPGAVAEGLTLSVDRIARAAGPRRVVAVEERPWSTGAATSCRCRRSSLIVIADSTTGTAEEAAAGARQRHRVEVRADDVERALLEGEARAGRDVRRGRDDERALAPVEIAERGAVEQDLVVELRRQLRNGPSLPTRGRPNSAGSSRGR